PSPWRHVEDFAIGGLRNIGFAPDSDVMLVVSSQGAGLFDCIGGIRLARDPDYEITYGEEVRLSANGIGVLSGQVIRMAGLHGGGLRTCTLDGWSLVGEAS